MPRPTKKKDTEIFDKELAKRIYDFRTKYVDPKQKVAAEMLGVSASLLSAIENGTRHPTYFLTETLVTKFDMNMEWFTSGAGPKKINDPAKPSSESSLQAVHTNVLSIMKNIKILEANLTHAFKIIQSQDQRIQQLEQKISKK